MSQDNIPQRNKDTVNTDFNLTKYTMLYAILPTMDFDNSEMILIALDSDGCRWNNGGQISTRQEWICIPPVCIYPMILEDSDFMSLSCLCV